jgi:hypothetical protein
MYFCKTMEHYTFPDYNQSSDGMKHSTFTPCMFSIQRESEEEMRKINQIIEFTWEEKM